MLKAGEGFRVTKPMGSPTTPLGLGLNYSPKVPPEGSRGTHDGDTQAYAGMFSAIEGTHGIYRDIEGREDFFRGF